MKKIITASMLCLMTLPSVFADVAVDPVDVGMDIGIRLGMLLIPLALLILAGWFIIRWIKNRSMKEKSN